MASVRGCGGEAVAPPTAERGRNLSGMLDNASPIQRGFRIWLSLVPAIMKEAYSALSTQVLMDKVLV